MIKLQDIKIDDVLIKKILDRGNDVWIKKTKTGIVILEAGFTKRGEIAKQWAQPIASNDRR